MLYLELFQLSETLLSQSSQKLPSPGEVRQIDSYCHQLSGMVQAKSPPKILNFQHKLLCHEEVRCDVLQVPNANLFPELTLPELEESPASLHLRRRQLL
jgi:hypothetical protein